MTDKSEAYLDGWFAHREGVAMADCNNPYPGKALQYSNTQWISGWCDRFEAIKYGKDLSLDEELFK